MATLEAAVVALNAEIRRYNASVPAAALQGVLVAVEGVVAEVAGERA